ncbi:MAG: YdcF family protein [Pseudomonadota bacterium]
MRRVVSIGLAICALGVLGNYVVFRARQHTYADASRLMLTSDVSTPETVVLTGGSKRIKLALELLRDGRTDHVFISGVGQKYSKAKLPAVPGLTEEMRACCISLGFSARNTTENGAESAAWLKQRGARRVFLITADFHMPRAMLELQRAAPNITIMPITVRQPRKALQHAAEFVKYSARMLHLPAPQRGA